MSEINTYSLSFSKKILLVTLSFMIVSLGQPTWGHWLDLESWGIINESILPILSSAFGIALFWLVLLSIPSSKNRFFLATAWFFAVQLVQLSWFISHPFWYIYFLYLFLAIAIGIQFGMIGILIRPSIFTNRWKSILIALLWTALEISRLFVFSGFSFNPIGLNLTSSIYSLQMASLFGIYGLSFWVIYVNLLALHAFYAKRKTLYILWALAAFFPYAYGIVHLKIHDQQIESNPPFKFTALLVQTAFPVEEALPFTSQQHFRDFVIDEWRQILTILKPHQHQSIDLIVLPEFTVPFGTYAFVYPFEEISKMFSQILGEKALKKIPNPEFPLGIPEEESFLVDNAYLVQAIANSFNANVLIGLEDADDSPEEGRLYYSSAQLFRPHSNQLTPYLFPERYEKRVLVPMGEYIPFTCFQKLAAAYGVTGSFTHGKESKVMQCGNVKISPSICYEETYSHIIADCKNKGAELLVNLTNDAWYPNSHLIRQHFDHARLRTVESGIPLIRACNTGITAAIDSLGRVIAMYGGENPEDVEWKPGALLVDVPLYQYNTLYSWLMKNSNSYRIE